MRPTLLLLSGNMCDARLWDGVRGALEGHPIAIPELVHDDRIDAMAARCLAEQDGPLIPIGFSMGAILALAIARLAPERIAAIALLDANPAADLPERAAVRPAQQAAARAGGLDRLVVEQLMPHYFAAANAGDARLIERVRAMARDLGPEAFVRQSEALRTRPDQRDVVAALDVPLLLACGAEDRLCPPAWHDAMRVAAPNAELHVVPGAGHMLPIERPAELGRLLARWLARVAALETVA